MNNENNVNATQNPNVTNTNVNPSVPNQTVNSVETPVAVAETAAATPSAPATTEVKPATNNLETIVVPSDFPEETPAQAATNVNMPTVVNPLEVKVEAKPEVAPEVKPVVANPEEQQVTEPKISEYQEKLRKAQENYKPPSNFQMFLTVFLFIFLIFFIIFLPDIAENIERLKAGPQVGPAPDPTTGTLICTLESSASDVDKTFKREFKYEENKLKSAVIETTTRGDASLDEELLDELNNKCVSIMNGLEGVSGAKLDCKYKDGLLVERESFDYRSFDKDTISSAYAEVGGSLIEFDYDADIDSIMKTMRQAGFTCNKEK